MLRRISNSPASPQRRWNRPDCASANANILSPNPKNGIVAPATSVHAPFHSTSPRGILASRRTLALHLDRGRAEVGDGRVRARRRSRTAAPSAARPTARSASSRRRTAARRARDRPRGRSPPDPRAAARRRPCRRTARARRARRASAPCASVPAAARRAARDPRPRRRSRRSCPRSRCPSRAAAPRSAGSGLPVPRHASPISVRPITTVPSPPPSTIRSMPRAISARITERASSSDSVNRTPPGSACSSRLRIRPRARRALPFTIATALTGERYRSRMRRVCSGHDDARIAPATPVAAARRAHRRGGHDPVRVRRPAPVVLGPEHRAARRREPDLDRVHRPAARAGGRRGHAVQARSGSGGRSGRSRATCVPR